MKCGSLCKCWRQQSIIYLFVQTKLDLFIRCPLVDVKKMPLGKLSKTQIAKGFEALEEIQAAVEGLYQNTPLQHLQRCGTPLWKTTN